MKRKRNDFLLLLLLRMDFFFALNLVVGKFRRLPADKCLSSLFYYVFSNENSDYLFKLLVRSSSFFFSLSLSLASLFSLSLLGMEETNFCGGILFARRSISFVSSPSSLERRRRSRRSSPRREKDDTTHFCWRSNDGARSISRSIVADENTIHVKTQQQNSSSETPVLGNPASSFASRTTRTKSRTSAPSGWTLKSELWNWKGKR